MQLVTLSRAHAEDTRAIKNYAKSTLLELYKWDKT